MKKKHFNLRKNLQNNSVWHKVWLEERISGDLESSLVAPGTDLGQLALGGHLNDVEREVVSSSVFVKSELFQ